MRRSFDSAAAAAVLAAVAAALAVAFAELAGTVVAAFAGLAERRAPASCSALWAHDAPVSD